LVAEQKKTFRKGSDIDIALIGNNVSHDTIRQIDFILNEELPLPYHFDLLNFQKNRKSRPAQPYQQGRRKDLLKQSFVFCTNFLSILLMAKCFIFQLKTVNFPQT
jgi:hypothetical protein